MIDLERRRELGELVSDSFALYRANLSLFLPIALVVIVPVDLAVLGIGLGQLTGGYSRHRANVAASFDGVVEALLLTPLVTAAHIAAVQALGRGERPTPWWSLQQAFEHFGFVVLAQLLAIVFVFFGALALIVPGVYLAVALFFAAQAVVAERLGPVTALRRSRELVRGRWWWCFGVGLVFSLLIGIPQELVQRGANALAKQADLAPIGLLGTIVSEVFGIAFTALGGTLTYFTLRAAGPGRTS